ncbi:MAG: hypothetical protein Q9174_005069, partial [Haloplaca sp. 1 TL-2023]
MASKNLQQSNPADEILAISKELTDLMDKMSAMKEDAEDLKKALAGLMLKLGRATQELLQAQVDENQAREHIPVLASSLFALHNLHCAANTEDPAGATTAAIAEMALSDDNKALLQATMNVFAMKAGHERHHSTIQRKTHEMAQAGDAYADTRITLRLKENRVAYINQRLAIRRAQEAAMKKDWANLEAQAKIKAALIIELSGAKDSLPAGFGEVVDAGSPWKEKPLRERITRKMDPMSENTTWETALSWVKW